jgi:hypothetical protein
MITFKSFLKEQMTKLPGTQYGSNDGGIHVDSNDKKWYVKHYSNPDHAKVEALTGKIYNHMGIKTLNSELHDKSGIKTRWDENVHTLKPHNFEKLNKKQAHQVGKMYHAAILTKNWDMVGLEHDNIVHNRKTKNLHSIDHGGAFHFRAQGSHKEYGPDISEKESLKNNNEASGHVFSNTFKKHPTAELHGLEAVKKIDDNHIHHLFKNSGLKNWKELHQNFTKRKKSLIDSYSK